MRQTNVSPQRDILIVGGTGEVGRATARALLELVPDGAGRIILAGRDEARAQAVAVQLHPSLRGRRLDVMRSGGWEGSLEGVGTVVLCVELPNDELARSCLRRGIHLVETSAAAESLRRLEALDALARSNGAQVLLSVGLAPGLTNLLAAHAHQRVDSCERIEIDVLIGAGDVHGEGALDWTLGRLARPFEVVDNGVTRTVHNFRDARKVLFAGEQRARRVYRFDFSDQHTLRHTLGVGHVRTGLTLDSRALVAAVAVLARMGATRVLASDEVRQRVARWSTHLKYGSARFHVQARAYGRDCVSVGVAGEREAEMTGRMTALGIKAIEDDPGAAGVAHVEQRMRAETIFPQLRTWGYTVHSPERARVTSEARAAAAPSTPDLRRLRPRG